MTRQMASSFPNHFCCSVSLSALAAKQGFIIIITVYTTYFTGSLALLTHTETKLRIKVFFFEGKKKMKKKRKDVLRVIDDKANGQEGEMGLGKMLNIKEENVKRK